MHDLRKFINIINESNDDEFDYGIDFPDAEDDDWVSAQPYLSIEQEKFKKKHAFKKNPKRRELQQTRYERDLENESRHIPKSAINYKPFKNHLIRFGKFGKRSAIGLDAEFRAEMGNVTHEAGVSCYDSYVYNDGYQIIEPDSSRAVYDVHGIDHILHSTINQFVKYFEHQKPMDIFLIHGHLASFGENGKYLEIGSDGEYLFNPSKPYNIEKISPERIYVGRNVNLIQYFDKRYGINKLIQDYHYEQEALRND